MEMTGVQSYTVVTVNT